MLQSSVPPTVFTYSAIIGGMVGAGELDRALHLHDKMQAPAWGSVKPNAYTYSSLIIGMGRAGRFADARALFCCAAEAAGLDGEELVRPAGRADLPSLQTNDLDTQLDEGSELADGKDLGHECLERETDASRPQQDLMNNVVVGAMLGACERCGRWQEGLSLLRAVENGKVPGTTGANIVMINSVLSVLGKAGQWRLAGEVYSRHVEVCDQVSRETLIAAYGGGGRVREAEIVFRDILGRGEAPKDYAFCGLIAAYRAANR